jgi:hypothetical protein
MLSYQLRNARNTSREIFAYKGGKVILLAIERFEFTLNGGKLATDL